MPPSKIWTTYRYGYDRGIFCPDYRLVKIKSLTSFFLSFFYHFADHSQYPQSTLSSSTSSPGPACAHASSHTILYSPGPLHYPSISHAVFALIGPFHLKMRFSRTKVAAIFPVPCLNCIRAIWIIGRCRRLFMKNFLKWGPISKVTGWRMRISRVEDESRKGRGCILTLHWG